MRGWHHEHLVGPADVSESYVQRHRPYLTGVRELRPGTCGLPTKCCLISFFLATRSFLSDVKLRMQLTATMWFDRIAYQASTSLLYT